VWQTHILSIYESLIDICEAKAKTKTEKSHFKQCDVIGQQSNRIRWKKNTQNKGYYTAQGHSKSLRSVSIKSWYATSYQWFVTDILFRTVSELSQLTVQILDTLRFWAPFGRGLKGNVRCSCWAHWKTRSGLPISVNWTFFARCYGWGTTSEYRLKIAILLQLRPVDPKFQVEGVAPTNHSFSQKTRLNNFSYGIKIWTDLSSVLSQCTRLTDRRTDRRTDTFLVASPRWHSMQYGKNGQNITEYCGELYDVFLQKINCSLCRDRPR